MSLADSALGIKGQTGVRFGRDVAGDCLGNSLTKIHCQLVHGRIQLRFLTGTGALTMGNGIINQFFVLRLLRRIQQQRRVGGGILWRKPANGLKITGIGHHSGHLFQRVQLVHVWFLSLIRGYSSAF